MRTGKDREFRGKLPFMTAPLAARTIASGGTSERQAVARVQRTERFPSLAAR